MALTDLLQEIIKISIHALRKECDNTAAILTTKILHISIHALRKECDIFETTTDALFANFYQRTP